MTSNFDPYVILGVAPSASDDEIKRAYTRLTKRIQAETNQYPTTAVAQLQIITSAYNLLMDATQRRNYDNAAKKASDDKSDLYFSMRVTSSKRAIIPLPEDQIIYLLVDII